MSETNNIIDKLISQGYNHTNAKIVADELLKVSLLLKPYLKGWLNGIETDYTCYGYSIIGLMNTRRMTYPAALLTIDWLIKEPEQAKKSIEKGVR